MMEVIAFFQSLVVRRRYLATLRIAALYHPLLYSNTQSSELPVAQLASHTTTHSNYVRSYTKQRCKNH